MSTSTEEAAPASGLRRQMTYPAAAKPVLSWPRSEVSTYYMEWVWGLMIRVGLGFDDKSGFGV
jgi:hypothetical protein